MEQFFQFVINHWGLWLLLVVIIGLLIFQEMRTQVGGVRRLTPQNLVNLMNHEQAIIIDVRSDEAYKSGHILGAINTPLKDIENNIKKLQKYKAKPVVVVCGSGQDSMKAGAILKKQGFENVSNLHGGLTAWQQASLPLVSEKQNKKKTK